MAKFPFTVKHNGTLYEPGREVPIGVEAKKEDAIADKTAKEIREELKALGVTKFPSNKKEDLIKQLEEAQKAAEEQGNEDEELEGGEPEDQDLENGDEGTPENEDPETPEEGAEGEGTILEQIINE